MQNDFNMIKATEDFSLAYAYVPWQRFTKIYDDLEKALMVGTIFPELDMPFEGDKKCMK